MIKTNKYLLSMAVSAALAPSASFAQLEEVVVTAQKREQNLQDVPIAISAVSQEMLEQTGINTITEVIPMVPGLTGSDYGLAQNSWAIRGISSNDDTIGSEHSVGVFFDDAYVGRNMFATGTFFDINRIEVVKGPQGTLFGRNSSAGAISLISNRPGDENELRLGVALGDEGQQRYEVVGNLAVSDSFALRLAYQHQEWEGMWEEINSGEDAYTETDTLRIMARWNVTDNFEALFRANYSNAETNYTSGVNIPFNLADPGEEYPDKYALNNPNDEEVEAEGFGMRLTWDINDALTLVSITDVRSGEANYLEDADNTAADAVIDAALGPATGGLTVLFDAENSADTVYQEFRLSGGSDSLSWFAGMSYYSEDMESPDWSTVIIDTAFGLGALGGTNITNKADNESYGVYADATWNVTEKLALIGGLRWSYDDKDWCSNTLQDDVGLGGGPTDGELCSNETWDEWTPRFVAQYDVGDDSMIFASVAKGYKGGGFNVGAADTNGDGMGDTIAPFDPETSMAYELGIKSTLLDGRAQLNGSVFYTDYDDLQLQSLTLAYGQVISNAGTAESQGLEMEFSYSPLDNLLLMVNYAYLDAEITDGDLDGNELAYAPENTFAAGINFNHSFLAGDLNWFALYTWTDDFYYEAVNEYSEEAYGLLNGKVTYTAGSGRWDLALAADNITDEGYGMARWDFGWGETIHWGYKRMIRAEFNINF
jgi:iron complex outermembrane recepter protein